MKWPAYARSTEAKRPGYISVRAVEEFSDPHAVAAQHIARRIRQFGVSQYELATYVCPSQPELTCGIDPIFWFATTRNYGTRDDSPISRQSRLRCRASEASPNETDGATDPRVSDADTSL